MLVTAPIFYTNSNPHIGAAHTMILCDFIARSHRILGFDVFLSVGTDEHGDKIFNAAQLSNKDPQTFVNEKYVKFKELADNLDISYNRFIRTTDSDHIHAVQDFWKKLQNKEYIYEGIYSGYYSLRDETFFQKEELIDNKAPTGAPVVFLEEKCFFIAFNKIENKIRELLKTEFTIPNNRINQVVEFISNGLKDLCISRKSKWGIQVPDSEEKIYVWFDALINYLTVCNYPNLNEYWNNVIHVVGKDILTFHALYWPAMLMLAEIPLCRSIVCHNWWIMKGQKMSKSLGNIIDPFEIIETYGTIALRLYCLKENLLHADQEFSQEDLINVYDTFFVKKFCNLIHRVFSVAKKHDKLHIEKGYYKEEFKQIILNCNSREYFTKFFEICDSLNKEVEEKLIWINPHSCHEIVKKINSLIDYIYPIIPNFPKDIHENSKQFMPLRG